MKKYKVYKQSEDTLFSYKDDWKYFILNDKRNIIYPSDVSNTFTMLIQYEPEIIDKFNLVRLSKLELIGQGFDEEKYE